VRPRPAQLAAAGGGPTTERGHAAPAHPLHPQSTVIRGPALPDIFTSGALSLTLAVWVLGAHDESALRRSGMRVVRQ